ncbi:MAG: hypothetical protein GYA24_01555 [Candidatus Lokiarchaeota archaeon]|nr:hypothetical protein [Candidatus Lokiarchaeota archaeon]
MPDIAFIVPVKSFKKAKTRLVELFPPASRPAMQEQLGIALFDDTMDVLGSYMKKHGNGRVCTIVSSSDPGVEARVSRLGDPFTYIDESNVKSGYKTSPSLDEIIEHANKHAMERLGVKGTVLLMSDLPLLNVHAIVGLFKRIDPRRHAIKVVLSPSMGNGCNMIARFPPDVIPTRYSSVHGPSFIEHLALAKKKASILGIPAEQFVGVYHNLDLYLDLDTPEDLINLHPLLKEIRPESHLSKILAHVDVHMEKRSTDDTRHVSIKVSMNGRA